MTNYLIGTRDGDVKEERQKGKTPTPTRLAQSGQTLKGQGKRAGKERADGRHAKHRPEEGGTEVLDTTYKARAKPTSAREGAKPDLEREHA